MTRISTTPDRARILIVDDDANNRTLLEVALAEEGFDLETATSGEDALRSVARQTPDLILLDIMMPGLDGYHVASTIKNDPGTKNIPIIVITAFDSPDAKLRGLKAGAEDFLTKPFDRAELKVRIRNLLRLKAYGDYHDKYSQQLEGEIGSRTADLVESERLYRSTFDAAPVGIVHVGLDGRWLRVNQRVCQLLGYAREELHPAALQSATEILTSDTELSLHRKLLGTRDRYPIEEQQFRRRDGTTLCARVNMSIHRNAEGRAQQFILVIEDITELRTLEAQVRQANRMDAIGQVVSGVAHDFNNLLSVVVSYSEMLADDLEVADPMRADVEEIRSAGWRAVELTRQLLAFSRQQVLQPKVIDLTTVVSGIEKMLRRVLGEGVVFSASHPPTLGSVLVDPGQMEQVLMNLVVNARDAMPQGGTLAIETADVVLDESYTIDHPGMKPGPHVMLTVTDTGIGMDRATQARIFEPFFTTKNVGKGTGLGLSTVFGIVRQSGGAISIKSELGKGSTFEIFFPMVRDAAIRAPSQPRRNRTTFRGCETVLLVEDDESVRALARTILRKFGYDVLEAENSGDALLLCEQHPSPIHLLLTDVVMPRMSGRQLSERLLLIRPDMKVLYMSGYMDDVVVRNSVLDSTVAFIQKPITPDALAQKIRETLVATADSSVSSLSVVS